MQATTDTGMDDASRPPGGDPKTTSSVSTDGTGTANGGPLNRSPTRKEQLQKSLGFYVAIETAWHLALFAACYRYRPMMRLSKTAAGKRVLQQLQGWTKRRRTENRGSSTGGTGSRVWQSMQRTVQAIPVVRDPQRAVVAFSEWFFFNKTIGIPLWPTKLFLAAWLSQKFEQYTCTSNDTT
ncbi:expressed unknown protein [Seminavis robusta]|uniref:Uncharacterized protein n=1 Tax=Seminavis robusta TaxID=568900 RepID=A0A9N8DLR6_9STRA|nr:expressed unknown protein [Seminavis robusta]|eukprot:Sro149_g068490.1 n/a (181) ;mRNA; r:58259-58801